MKKLFALALILVIFWVGNTSVVQVKASPTVHNVGPNAGQFPTITAALASGLVQPGDVIHVWDKGSGTDYQENPVITIPNIKIIGETTQTGSIMVFLCSAAPGPCFTIMAPGVTIMDLLILDTFGLPGDIGILIMPPAAGCIIMDNAIGSFDWGILISDSPNNQIIGNEIAICRVTPPPPFCSTGVFIYGPNSINNVVRGNWMHHNSIHVQTNQASGNTITFNNFDWWGPPDNIPQASVVAGDINLWCDPGLQKGNYWNDPSLQPPYIIDPNNVDIFCSPARYDWTTMPWDLNRDLKCDIRDVATAAVAYGSQWSMPNWNPTADISGGPDGKIDIRDIATIAVKFGWTDP